MSSDAFLAGEALENSRSPSRSDKILKRLLAVLAIILAVELVWLFGITPCMPFNHVEIKGLPELSDGELIARAGIAADSSFINFDSAGAASALEELYMVGEALVEKRFPDTLRISLKPRKACAVAFAAYQGKICPVFFDQEGVVFRIGAPEGELKALSERLPIISGLAFENLAPGIRLPENLKPLLGNLESINTRNPLLLSLLSEIRVHKKPYDGYELVLYPAHAPIRFRVGPELNEEMLRYIMLVIDVFRRQGVEVDEIDFRGGTASFKPKEVRFGQ
ncbi:MAG: FtsQ-type POTRA domain-containing protein [Spirochaetaceae bacterium]|nr:FtsQ-type POTRA domain-containing protein [Spirochaetaceae bacterium]